MSSSRAVVCLAMLALAPEADAAERQEIEEEISVTATRAPRRTRDVPQAITVVGKDTIDDKVVFNVKDVVTGTPGVLIESKNGGYDARVIIRGAGLKASYGVREIMLLRDGVPLTDPDSFSRLDWVDTQDVERIEITKGPGNLFSPGTAGGAIQIISKSVFDRTGDAVQAGYGTFGQADLHLRKGFALGARQAITATASYRRQENDWRAWNHFETLQVSLKHGLRLGAGTLESEAAFTQASTQLPGSMNDALWAEFKRTGKQTTTSEPWRNSGRTSKILFFNTKLEQPVGDLTLKPRVYYNQWTHTHPVTGAINQTEDWNRTLGTDLEAVHRHGLGSARGTLVAGVTAKGQWDDDSRKYQYADFSFDPSAGMTITHSDRKGALMQTQSSRFMLGGVFLQESVQWARVTVDLGGRVDRSWMRVRTNELTTYDYASGAYRRGAGASVVDKRFDLPAPKAGISVRATDALSVYASAAQAAQVPSESEVLSNRDLSPSRSTSYEVGVKVRSAWLTLDAAGFYNPVKDEIILTRDPAGQSVYQNAGETRKLGAEASAAVRVPGGFEVGGSYAYSDFTFVTFRERVGRNLVSRDGKRLPYVPLHQYGAFATWRHPVGLRLRVQTNTWGRYWEDNANTARYGGYTFLTGAGAAWAFGRHEVLVDAQNLLDQRYAVSVTRDTTGKTLYTAGTPRTVFGSYKFSF